jgi:hypothetical protein
MIGTLVGHDPEAVRQAARRGSSSWRAADLVADEEGAYFCESTLMK